MGQYYKPVSLEKKEFLYSHDYKNGLKLMEHSWLDNNFINAVEHLLKRGGKWYGDSILWAGDYADNEPDSKNNIYGIVDEEGKKIKPSTEKKDNSLRYLKNLDTKEFVDLKKVPVTELYEGWEWRIHPLPLLTCEGNGRGGGDYRGSSDLVGKWARNRVIIQKSKPRNCKELIFDLVE